MLSLESGKNDHGPMVEGHDWYLRGSDSMPISTSVFL